MPTTTSQGLPYPALSDAANGPAAVQNLALAVEKQLVQTFSSAADRTAKLTAAGYYGPSEGMLSYLRDVDQLQVYTGSQWVAYTSQAQGAPYAEAMGQTTASGTNIAAGTSVTVNVTFPAGRFTVAPLVVGMLAGFVGGSSNLILRQIDTIDTNGCRLVVWNPAGQNTTTFTGLPITWHAVQMTSTTAAG